MGKTVQKIELSAAGRAKLAKVFGVTTQCIGQALNFKSNSVQAQRIRVAALKEGASLVQIVDVTEQARTAIRVLNAKGETVQVINQ